MMGPLMSVPDMCVIIIITTATTTTTARELATTGVSGLDLS